MDPFWIIVMLVVCATVLGGATRRIHSTGLSLRVTRQSQLRELGTVSRGWIMRHSANDSF